MKPTVVSALFASALIVSPAFAQTATETQTDSTAPAVVAPAEGAPAVVIKVPEGYAVTELTSVTADQLKGVDIYDPTDTKIAEIADLVIGPDEKVTGIVTDVGGFLGLGEHRVSLAPDQVTVYKNADNDIRAYVSLTKDELKALPKYEAPNQ